DGDDTFVFLNADGANDDNDTSRPTEPGGDCITDFNGVASDDGETDVIDISDFTIAGGLFVSDETGALDIITDFDAADEDYDGSSIFAIQTGSDVQVIVDLDGSGSFTQDDLEFFLKDFDADDLMAADFITSMV
ncbi:hypothetical protein, partial [Paralimibaculum aggregatum]|uniref:hypothetical protein n=1 Tax=Paralimibaculum aggregatum TaxID=3036245 RepID=UPI00255283D2